MKPQASGRLLSPAAQPSAATSAPPSAPRPNTAPSANTLSSAGPPATSSPGASGNEWNLPRPSTPMPANPGRSGRRPANRLQAIWTLIVFGFIAFNFVRGFLASNTFGSDSPTTAPAAPTPRLLGPTPRFSIDPNVLPGAVTFGEASGTNCDVTKIGTSFALGTRVWWSATLGVELPSDTDVSWQVTRNGAKIGGESVPGDSSGGTWNVLCGNEPITGETSGTYVLQVTDDTQRIVLSTGTYTVRGS